MNLALESSLGIGHECEVSSNHMLYDSYLVPDFRIQNPSLVEGEVNAGGSSLDGLLHTSLDSRDCLKGIGYSTLVGGCASALTFLRCLMTSVVLSSELSSELLSRLSLRPVLRSSVLNRLGLCLRSNPTDQIHSYNSQC